MEGLSVDQLSASVLLSMNEDMAKKMDGSCVLIRSPLVPPLDDQFRVAIEEIRDGKGKGNHLVILLETPGGYMETVERLVSVMREHFKRVSFVIPNFAYSAGTVLALSGDDIYMDYYSVLGPIDPQYQDPEGTDLLPGAGYLAKYNELVGDINDPDVASDAQLAYLVSSFDPARLFHIEQNINHGISLITEWLTKYKFKNWTKIEGSGARVTPETKKTRAEEIARILGNAEKWHSHGRGIPMRELRGKEIKLEIKDFGADAELSHLIRHYHGLCVDYYTNKSAIQGYIHSSAGMRRVL